MKEKITVSIFVLSVITTCFCACCLDSSSIVPGVIGMVSTLIALASMKYLTILQYRHEHRLHKGEKIKWDL